MERKGETRERKEKKERGRGTERCLYVWSGVLPPPGRIPGRRDTPQYVAQGSHTDLNFFDWSAHFATICSCDIIQETFLLNARKETEGFFHALAMVILAPNSMKNAKLWDCLGRPGIHWFNSATLGCGEITVPSRAPVARKTFFQKALMRGQDHHV